MIGAAAETSGLLAAAAPAVPPAAAPRSRRRRSFIATLGQRPAVVTTALDLLLADGWTIDEVLVLHTSPAVADAPPGASPLALDRIAHALSALDAEFPEGGYGPRRLPIGYRRLALERDGRPVFDVDDSAEAEAVFRALYQQVQERKRRGDAVHLCISGGRKIMAVYGMAVAQLLFDADDRLWHVSSTDGHKSTGAMHPRLGADAALVAVPVLALGLVHLGPVAELLRTGDPVAAVDRQRAAGGALREARCLNFLDEALSPEERRLVKALLHQVVGERASSGSRDLAELLCLSERTVRNRLSEIYDKLRQHFQLHEQPVDKEVLIGLYAPYYERLVT